MTHAETALQTTERLIRERMPQLLGDKFTISRIETSTFRRNNHDVNYMTVFFKPGHPPLDSEEIDEFTSTVWKELVSRDMVDIPAVAYVDDEAGP